MKKHTTAAAKMSKLDKILYVADKVSSDRKGHATGKTRKLAYSNLNLTFVKILKQQLKKLEKKGIKIEGSALEAYKSYILPKEKKNGIKKI
jgi:nicotinate-nucleotide adenylyltransferase